MSLPCLGKENLLKRREIVGGKNVSGGEVGRRERCRNRKPALDPRVIMRFCPPTEVGRGLEINFRALQPCRKGEGDISIKFKTGPRRPM